nr:MAG TPA: hypothetical protein [Caudoviricetes sp.]
MARSFCVITATPLAFLDFSPGFNPCSLAFSI